MAQGKGRRKPASWMVAARRKIAGLEAEVEKLQGIQKRLLNGDDPRRANTFLMDYVHDDLPLGSSPMVRFGPKDGGFRVQYDSSARKLTVRGGLDGVFVKPVTGNEVVMFLSEDQVQ